MGLPEVFNEAAERVKQVETPPSIDDQLILYANFKQANIGDCNTSKPGLFDFKGKEKWVAWYGVKGTSKDDAMHTYIAKVDSLCGTSLASKV